MGHPSRAMQCSRCCNAPWVDHTGQNSTQRITFCFLTRPQTESSLESYFLGILAKADRSRTEEPGGLQSLGSQRVRWDWVTEQIHTYKQKQDNKVMGFHIAHATAKLLQSCPTLCYPMDCSPPGFSIHGILQARTLEWVATLHMADPKSSISTLPLRVYFYPSAGV